MADVGNEGAGPRAPIEHKPDQPRQHRQPPEQPDHNARLPTPMGVIAALDHQDDRSPLVVTPRSAVRLSVIGDWHGRFAEPFRRLEGVDVDRGIRRVLVREYGSHIEPPEPSGGYGPPSRCPGSRICVLPDLRFTWGSAWVQGALIPIGHRGVDRHRHRAQPSTTQRPS